MKSAYVNPLLALSTLISGVLCGLSLYLGDWGPMLAPGLLYALFTLIWLPGVLNRGLGTKLGVVGFSTLTYSLTWVVATLSMQMVNIHLPWPVTTALGGAVGAATLGCALQYLHVISRGFRQLLLNVAIGAALGFIGGLWEHSAYAVLPLIYLHAIWQLGLGAAFYAQAAHPKAQAA